MSPRSDSAILECMERKNESRAFAVPEGLSPTEEKLLAALRSRPGEVLSRRELLETMHGKGRGNVEEHAVDAMVSRLRKALGPGGACIETIRGEGFRWNPDRVTVDPATGNVRVGGSPVELIPCEAALMAKLASRPGRTFSRAELAGGGGRKGEPPSRAADGIVSSLRRKLGAAGRCIETDHGRGYRFVPEPRPRASAARRAFLAVLLVAAASAGWLLRPGREGEPEAKLVAGAVERIPLPPPFDVSLLGAGMGEVPGHGPERAIDGTTNTWYQSAGPARKKDGLVVEYHPSVRGTLSVQCGVPGSTNAPPAIRVGVDSNDGSGTRMLGVVDPASGFFSGDIGEPSAFQVFLIVAADSDEPLAVQSVWVDP